MSVCTWTLSRCALVAFSRPGFLSFVLRFTVELSGCVGIPVSSASGRAVFGRLALPWNHVESQVVAAESLVHACARGSSGKGLRVAWSIDWCVLCLCVPLERKAAHGVAVSSELGDAR